MKEIRIFTIPEKFKPKKVQMSKKRKVIGFLILLIYFLGSAIFLSFFIYKDSKTNKSVFVSRIKQERKGTEQIELPSEKEKKINILEIYPDQPILKQIFENHKNDPEIKILKIEEKIDSLKIEDLNQDVDLSSYNLIVFGFADCNSQKDLKKEVVSKVEKFILEDKGVIFGHDTLCFHKNFNKLNKYAGIKDCQAREDFFQERTNSKVKQARQGSLVEKPYLLLKEFPIQETHLSGQSLEISDPHLEIWYKFSNGNAWLSTYKKTGLIQTGDHTFNKICQADEKNLNQGIPNKEERKAIINLIHYLGI